jgi:hypothetical protein
MVSAALTAVDSDAECSPQYATDLVGQAIDLWPGIVAAQASFFRPAGRAW